jgi:uncharacterized protein
MPSENSFTITASPATDAWRKPPSKDDFNAPSRSHSKFPLSSFQRARVTFAASWVETYDQGGLLLSLTHATHRSKWLKTGVEYYTGRTFISTVGTDNWSDWSIYPVDLKPNERVTLELVRDNDKNGEGLWVYWLKLDENGNVTDRLPLREICWLFAEKDGWQVEVGAYAARPEAKVDGGLDVTFWDLEVDRT